MNFIKYKVIVCNVYFGMYEKKSFHSERPFFVISNSFN